MKYYKLYKIPVGGRKKDAVDLNVPDKSKRALDNFMWAIKNNFKMPEKLFITEVNEKEVSST